MGLDSSCSPPDFLWRYPVDRALKPYGPIGGDHPTIKELIDYDPFCGIPGEIGRAISQGKPTCTRRSGSAAGQFNPDEVTVQDMKKALDDPKLGIKVIDVRSPHEMASAPISRGEPDEYEIARVNGVPLLPLSQINQRFTELDPNQQYYLHCKAGVRSLKALNFLRQQGFKYLKSVKGGLTARREEIDSKVPRY